MDLTNETDVAFAVGVAFPAGNDDFRAARDRCSHACRRFNETPEDSPGEIRSTRYLDIVRPGRDRADDAGAAITHDMTFRNPKLKAQTPFVKPPFWVDYGLRLRIGGSTFINRGCMIMDTPVADVTIGEECNIGPNCVIISVSHPLRAEDRAGKSSIGRAIAIGDHVWIGANVTILGGVTIGDGAVVGAGSVITKNIPARTMAFGVPARVVQDLTADEAGSRDYDDMVNSLTEAMMHGRHLDRKAELELARLSVKLSLLQQQKLARQQQQLKAAEAQQEEQAMQVRRGSDAPSDQEFQSHKPQPVMLLLAAMLVALMTSMATLQFYRV